MIVRFHVLPVVVSRVRAGRLAAAVAFAFALNGAGAGIAHAATTDAASAPAVVESDAQYTVRPGQSLNDIAIALTQSHDRATLARASKAIFDANPSAFMGHDPSRMRIGAVLNVPSLDSLGMPASAPVAGSAAASASGAVSAASAAAPAAVASAPAVPALEASVPAASNAAANPTTNAVPNNASAATGASAPAASSAVAAASGASQPVEAAAQASQAASGAHVWTGAIQAGSAPAEGASAVTAPATAAALAPQAASQARTSVSSLQQLLALKNRVLMELQKHGIVPVGKVPQAGSAAAVSSASMPGSGAAVAPGSGATVGSAVVAGNATGAGAAGLSPEATAGVAAAVAAVIALILSLTFRRRRRPAANASSTDPVGKAGLPAVVAADDDIQAQAFPPIEPGTSENATGAASLAAAAELGAEALPMEQIDPAAHELEEDEGARYVGSATHDEALKAAAFEDAGPSVEPTKPPTPVTPVEPELTAAHEATPQVDAPDAYVAPDVHHETPVQHADAPAAALESTGAPAENVPAQPAAAEPVEPPPHVSEFPREAVAALGGLDMALPPRTEPPAPFGEMKLDGFPPAASQPVVEPEITAREAVSPPPPAPRAADVISAGTAGSAAVAGLGAMPFGALKLDFDLELPPSPAQSLPAFTQEDLSKIARNKLELAAEYIELGDLSGARTLVNEVIESNDAATRNEARALLSTLAPRS
ncbi:FimV/HubP family polar landmark protein [Paraburkholderia saeva]|nr:hypothetical protein R52603_00124 [Paraburkholderia saeva]